MSDTVRYFANEADVPEGTLVDLFFAATDRLADRPAYLSAVAGDPSWDYARVRRAVAKGAAALSELGLERGDRAAILAENRVEWALADWSCLCAGVIDVPVYATLPAAQVAYILRDSGASLAFVSDAEQAAKVRDAAKTLENPIRIVVFDAAAAAGDALSWDDFLALGAAAEPGAFEERARRARPHDVATMIYTSGTTGRPKGVMLTHNNVASNVWACTDLLIVGPGDASISFLPLSHILQRMVDYLLFSRGCAVAHGAIDAIARDMKRLRPTMLASVPRLYEKVHQGVLDAGGVKGRLTAWAAEVARRVALHTESGAQMPFSLRWRRALADRLVFSKIRRAVGGRLRYFVSGGAALAPDIARFFLGAGLPILEGYGLSETSPVTNVNTMERFRIGTVGRPVPGTEIRIADDGEILVRGPQVMKGYHGMEEKTRETISEDGWLSTGDVGELSRDGFLRITDRKKDLIKTSGGKYVAPQMIENLLKRNPYVDQAVAVGEGRKFCAVLVLPAFERLGAWAAEAGVEDADQSNLLADPRCQALLQEEVLGELRDLARFETPKKIGLLKEPFTVEDGTLTPTMKVRRRAVAERHADAIDAFYRAENAERTVFAVDA